VIFDLTVVRGCCHRPPTRPSTVEAGTYVTRCAREGWVRRVGVPTGSAQASEGKVVGPWQPLHALRRPLFPPIFLRGSRRALPLGEVGHSDTGRIGGSKRVEVAFQRLRQRAALSMGRSQATSGAGRGRSPCCLGEGRRRLRNVERLILGLTPACHWVWKASITGLVAQCADHFYNCFG
jgi:hypothetical protein